MGVKDRRKALLRTGREQRGMTVSLATSGKSRSVKDGSLTPNQGSALRMAHWGFLTPFCNMVPVWSVSWEGPNPLQWAIYSDPLSINAIQAKYPGETLTVTPLIVGARGIWCCENRAFVGLLNLSDSDIRSFVTKTTLHDQLLKCPTCLRPWLLRQSRGFNTFVYFSVSFIILSIHILTNNYL